MRISGWSSDVCSSDLQSGSAARALELTILCATRPSETLNATWSEFDLDSALWTIPKERMKMHVEHRVPLSNSAVELLRATAANSNRPPDAYVFAGQKRGCPLSNVSMTAVLKRIRLGHLTVHGMRSKFRDYRSEDQKSEL